MYDETFQEATFRVFFDLVVHLCAGGVGLTLSALKALLMLRTGVHGTGYYRHNTWKDAQILP
jgi:hypothetical protein